MDQEFREFAIRLARVCPRQNPTLRVSDVLQEFTRHSQGQRDHRTDGGSAQHGCDGQSGEDPVTVAQSVRGCLQGGGRASPSRPAAAGAAAGEQPARRQPATATTAGKPTPSSSSAQHPVQRGSSSVYSSKPTSSDHATSAAKADSQATPASTRPQQDSPSDGSGGASGQAGRPADNTQPSTAMPQQSH